MGTSRMIKSRMNRFFDGGSISEWHADRPVGSWPTVARIPRSRFCSDAPWGGHMLQGEVMMKKSDADLLGDPRVRKEIERYKWVESEKAGYDIGMARANRVWLALYAEAWKKMNPRKRVVRKPGKVN